MAQVETAERAGLVELAPANRLASDDSAEPNAPNEEQVISNQLVASAVRAPTVG